MFISALLGSYVGFKISIVAEKSPVPDVIHSVSYPRPLVVTLLIWNKALPQLEASVWKLVISGSWVTFKITVSETGVAQGAIGCAVIVISTLLLSVSGVYVGVSVLAPAVILPVPEVTSHKIVL